MLFRGDGVPHQRARGLMWLEVAKDAAVDPSESWIRDLYQRDFELASDGERQAAAVLRDTHAKGRQPSTPVRDIVKFILKPLGPLVGSTGSPAQ